MEAVILYGAPEEIRTPAPCFVDKSFVLLINHLNQ